jgi:hypothetical protein
MRVVTEEEITIAKAFASCHEASLKPQQLVAKRSSSLLSLTVCGPVGDYIGYFGLLLLRFRYSRAENGGRFRADDDRDARCGTGGERR